MGEEKVGKTGADRTRNAQDVVVAMKEQGPEVAAATVALILEGKPSKKLDFAEWIDLFTVYLEERTTLYAETDLQHQMEMSGDLKARNARDAAVVSLRDVLVRTSQSVSGALGAAVCSELALDTSWATRPDLLVAQARNAVGLMRAAERRTVTGRGVKIDIAELADAVDADCTSVVTALNVVVHEDRRAQRTFQKRERMAREWERIYPAIAELFMSLCVLIGDDELAARVKPPARRGRPRKDTTSNGSTPAPTTTSSGSTPAPVTSTGSTPAPAIGHDDKSDIAAE